LARSLGAKVETKGTAVASGARRRRPGGDEPMATVLPELVSYLEGLPEPHILFDRQYRILAANAAYRRQFSPQGSVVGRTCYEVSHHFSVPCDQAGESCPLARARESGQRERCCTCTTRRRASPTSTSSWCRCATPAASRPTSSRRWSRCAWRRGSRRRRA
jgi:PAS domain-containing protein